MLSICLDILILIFDADGAEEAGSAGLESGSTVSQTQLAKSLALGLLDRKIR